MMCSGVLSGRKLQITAFLLLLMALLAEDTAYRDARSCSSSIYWALADTSVKSGRQCIEHGGHFLF